MAFWRPLARGWHALTHRAAVDREAADEVADYLDHATEAFMANGLSPEAARRAARMELGNPALVREDLRTFGWEHAVETLAADLRYAARRLRGQPAFALVVILTLSLGIGTSTAVFSVAKPVLFDSLPYPHPSQLVTIWDFGTDGSRQDVTFGSFREIQDRTRAFQALAVIRSWQPTLTGSAEPERLDGQRVSARYFDVLGIRPMLGRSFHDEDDRINAPPVVILSHALWRRRFAGDGTIIGQHVKLDDDPYTVVGVMPEAFENVLAPASDIWRPLQYDTTLPSFESREWGHHLHMLGRTSAGVSLASAKSDLHEIAATRIEAYTRPAWASMGRGLIVTPLQEDLTREVRPALFAVLGAVTLLLLIVGVNVTNLLLGRSAQQQREFSMRVALGAGRVRLSRQVITETLLLALCGGGIGMAVAAASMRALVAASPATLPRAHAIALDASVFTFALAFSTVVGIVIGILPALHATRREPICAPHGSRHTIDRHWVRRTFVVAEVALSLVILIGAGLLLRSVERLLAVPAGFDAEGRLTMQVQASGHRFDDPAATHAFFASALDAVRQVPGVVSAAFTSQLPLSGESGLYGAHFESVPTPESNEDRGAARYAVTPEYFSTLGIPLRRGRLLDAHDTKGAPLAVLLNESFARRRFPGQDPLGQRLRIGPDSGPWYTVVGIVGDVKQTSLEIARGDAVYLDATQWPYADRVRSLVVHTEGPPALLTAKLLRAIWSVDKDQPVTRVATMESLVAASAAERRFALTLFEVFGVAALALAAFGIYGVLSGSVTERRREIGVRSALGASRAHLLALVMGQGMSLTVLGVAVGVGAAMVASQGLASLLFDTPAVDPATYAWVIAVLLAVSAIACWLPAWRAARVDPAMTLRSE